MSIRKAIRRPAVQAKTGLGRSAIYAGMAQGWFPKNFDLIPGGNAKAWDEEEVDEFLAKRKAERDSKASA